LDVTNPKAACIGLSRGLHELPCVTDQRYWDQVLVSYLDHPGRLIWRASCDAIHTSLLQAWLGPHKAWGKVLKTDLFDEAVSEGLFPELSQIAREIHGIDLAPEVVSAAQSHHPELQVMCADIRSLPYPESSFDLVFSNSTLDHFSDHADLERSLRELHRVLQPGGSLLITLDNLDNPVIAVRRRLPMLRKIGLVPFFPGVTLNAAGLRRVLEASGFSVSSERTIMHSPRALAVGLAALLSRGPVSFAPLFHRTVLGLEKLEHWPTKRFTGYYVAALAKAVKTEGATI